jgi:hypothetical protein
LPSQALLYDKANALFNRGQASSEGPEVLKELLRSEEYFRAVEEAHPGSGWRTFDIDFAGADPTAPTTVRASGGAGRDVRL